MSRKATEGRAEFRGCWSPGQIPARSPRAQYGRIKEPGIMQGNPGQQRKFPGGPTVRHQCAGPQSCQMGTSTQNQTPKSEKQISDRCAAFCSRFMTHTSAGATWLVQHSMGPCCVDQASCRQNQETQNERGRSWPINQSKETTEGHSRLIMVARIVPVPSLARCRIRTPAWGTA